MKKTQNQTRIVGYIHSFGEANGRNMLEVKTSGPNSKNPGTEFIAGTIQVAVDEAGLNVIPVHFTYVTENYGSSGKANPNFSVLKRIINDGKCIVNNGKDEALKVAIDGAVALNDFYTDPDDEKTLVSSKVIEGSFVNIVNELPVEDERHTFKTDMVITKITRVEADEEKKIDKDYVVVRGAVFNFRNDILPMEFTVTNEAGMAYFEKLDPAYEPIFTKVWGKINCITTVVTQTEESAFGEAAVRTFERKTREWVITGTAKETFDFGDEEVLTAADLQTAMQNREIYLAEQRKRSKEYKDNKSATPAAAPAAPKAKTGAFNF